MPHSDYAVVHTDVKYGSYTHSVPEGYFLAIGVEHLGYESAVHRAASYPDAKELASAGYYIELASAGYYIDIRGAPFL
jgi:hypothetical protein